LKTGPHLGLVLNRLIHQFWDSQQMQAVVKVSLVDKADLHLTIPFEGISCWSANPHYFRPMQAAGALSSTPGL
jgi:hypothetical protein